MLAPNAIVGMTDYKTMMMDHFYNNDNDWEYYNNTIEGY